MSFRKRCGSFASMISAAPCSSATTAAKGLALARRYAMLRAVYTFAAAALLIGLSTAGGDASQATKPPVNADAATIQDFLKRVDQYVALHKKLEDPLPTLPKQTTPEQIDTHERALGKLIQEARKDAEQGDILTLGMQRFFRNPPPP